MGNSKRIVLGSGKVYVDEFSDTIPEDTAIETDANLIGYIKGGATLEYTPSFYEAKDDLGYVSEMYLTEEEAVLKTGVMTWNGDTIHRLSATARVTEDASTKMRTVKIGGIGNFDNKKYLIRFVHEDNNDGDVRVTISGMNQSGWTLTFQKDAETVLNAEFKAMPCDSNGTLIIYTEEDAAITQNSGV